MSMYGPRGMDRDRDRRPREIPPEDQYGSGRGQSYRPGNVRERTPPPPRMDSYRARSPPRRTEFVDSYTSDSYRGPRARSRTPPRRDDFRRRSPSLPRFRDREPIPRGGDSYRARPRSPPLRREELPRNDLFRREPARNERDFRDTRDFRDERERGFVAATRSPLPRFRERSPLPPKIGREPSPISSRGRRTPPPAKRDRITSPPRGRFDSFPSSRAITPSRRRPSPDPRDRRTSPPRSITRDFRARSRSPMPRFENRPLDDRRRPRSPPRDNRLDQHRQPGRDDSTQGSARTSTRANSPTPKTASLQQPPSAESHTLPVKDVTDSSDARPLTNARNDVVARPETAVLADRTQPLPREPIHAPSQPQPQTPGPPAVRENAREETPPSRPLPTGPRAATSGATPASTATNTPSTAHAKTPGPPPSGPRGLSSLRGDFPSRGRGGFNNDFNPRGRGGFGSPYRGGRGGPGPGPGPGSGLGRGDTSTDSPRAPPSGPRTSFSGNQAPPLRPFNSNPNPNPPIPFHRSSSSRFLANSTPSTDTLMSDTPPPPTGPKATRTNLLASASSSLNTTTPLARRIHPALLDLPKILDAGLRADPLIDRAKLIRLEEEAEKLRKQLDEKDARRRKSLREWDRLARDTEIAGLRSELAEQALRALNGEMESQTAF